MKIFGLEITRRKSALPRGAIHRTAGIKYILPRWIRGDYTLRNSELLFSATSRISNSLAAMPVRLYKGTRPIADPLNDLIHSIPNPNMTSTQFFKTMEACRCTYGNCYALIIRDQRMQPYRLDVLDPSRVEPFMNEDTDELWYTINPEKGQAYYIHGAHVIHIPFISTNGYMGINPVSVLFDTLSYSGEIKKFSVEQLSKGLNASIILEAPANLGEKQKESMIRDLQDTYKNTGGNIVLLESGVTSKAMNLSPVDAKLFEVEKITRGKVAMVYGIPPHMLGDYSDTSFASQEQQMLEFLSLTMLPVVTAYEQELKKKLLTWPQRKAGYEFRFNMDAILRADAKTMAEVNQKAVRGGWKLINEIRAEQGRPRLKEGDKALASRDLTTLQLIVENPELTYTNGGGANGANKEDEGTGDEGNQP